MSFSHSGKLAGWLIMKVLFRPEAPFLSDTREGGTLNAFASCLLTAALARPSVGGAVVLTRSRPSATPIISLRLPRGCTRTGISKVESAFTVVEQIFHVHFQIAGRRSASTIFSAISSMNTKYAERSTTPSGGTILRIGRKSGSVRSLSKSDKGPR